MSKTADPLPNDKTMTGLGPGRLRLLALRRGFWIGSFRGRDRFGPTYAARSLLDGRSRSLRVLRPDWSSRPGYTARLAREVLAAAQIDHPNLVHIESLHPLGGTLLLVGAPAEGRTLAEVLMARKRLEPRDAAVAVLQAARGLKHAHDRGLRHRHIEPGSLWLERGGLVLLSGIGLLPDADRAEELERREDETTRRPLPPGRPAGPPSPPGDPQTAPDPVAEADAADRQADIAALGRTLAALLSGRTDGPDNRGRDTLPEGFAPIVRRMIGAGPEPAYREVDEAIADLEGFLDLSAADPSDPEKALSTMLPEAAERFHNRPAGRLRARVLQGAIAGLGAIVGLSLLAGWWFLAVGLLGLGLLTGLFYGLAASTTRRAPLFETLRSLAVSSMLADPLSWIVGAVLVILALWVLKLLGVVIVFGVAAVLLVVAFRRTIDRRDEAERHAALKPIRAALHELRLDGHDEESLRRLVYFRAGPRAEGLVEAVFGPEALIEARARFGPAAASESRGDVRAWRDRLVERLAALFQARRDQRLEPLLQALEERSRCARGVNLLTARRKGRRVARALVTMIAELRAAPSTTTPPDVAGLLREAARNPEMVLVDHESGLIAERSRSRLEPVLSALLGPRTRLLVGAGLVAGCLLWLHQNGLIPGRALGELATQAAQVRDLEAARELGAAAEALAQSVPEVPEQTTPLVLPPLPRTLTVPLGSFGAGVAGLILLVSSAFSGWRLGLFVVPAALLALFGPNLGLPGIGPLGPEGASMALAALLALGGILFGRGR